MQLTHTFTHSCPIGAAVGRPTRAADSQVEGCAAFCIAIWKVPQGSLVSSGACIALQSPSVHSSHWPCGCGPSYTPYHSHQCALLIFGRFGWLLVSKFISSFSFNRTYSPQSLSVLGKFLHASLSGSMFPCLGLLFTYRPHSHQLTQKDPSWHNIHHWNKLCRMIVDSLSLEVFHIQWDQATADLIIVLATILLQDGGWTRWPAEVQSTFLWFYEMSRHPFLNISLGRRKLLLFGVFHIG